MADVIVDVDERAVRDLFTDWRSPVGRAVEIVVDEIENIATGLAPVSPIGSRLAPRGFLRESVHQSAEHHYDPDGHVIGLVGVAVFPYSFISNFRSHKGWTANARSAKHPGRFTTRRADNNFMERALEIAPHITIGQP